MAAAGNPVIIGIPVPFTAVQAQAEAKLFPQGGVFGPVAASSAAKHDDSGPGLQKDREARAQDSD